MHKYRAVSATADVEQLFGMALVQNFIPIVDDRKLFVGIVTRQRIIKHLCEQENSEAAFGATKNKDIKEV